MFRMTRPHHEYPFIGIPIKLYKPIKAVVWATCMRLKVQRHDRTHDYAILLSLYNVYGNVHCVCTACVCREPGRGTVRQQPWSRLVFDWSEVMWVQLTNITLDQSKHSTKSLFGVCIIVSTCVLCTVHVSRLLACNVSMYNLSAYLHVWHYKH